MFLTYILGVQSNFRGAGLIKKLSEFGISPTIVWGPQVGIEDRLISASTNQDFARFAINREIKPQEVACCLGHIRMYEKFFESEAEWGFFLEDDAIALQDPSPFIENLMRTSVPLHIFIHDGPGTNLPFRQESLFANQGLVRHLDPQYGAYGYLLNRAAVSLILESSVKKLINTPDWPYFWPRKIKYLVSKEIFISHPLDLSMSIIGERINKETSLTSQLPKIHKVLIGLKFNSNFIHFLYKEIYLKTIRLSLQILKKISK